ncbi:hypothetical protein GQ457_11G002110 [Hibiscus cannabinus]
MFNVVIGWSIIKFSWIWERTRVMQEKVCWQKVVWFSSHILKNSIITWMVILNWLSTKDRSLDFGITHSDACLLCEGGRETRNCLFFE